MKKKNIKPISLILALTFTVNAPMAFGNDNAPDQRIAPSAANILSTTQTSQPLSEEVHDTQTVEHLPKGQQLAIPKITADDQKDIDDFGNDLDKRVDQFINEYNTVNPPYVLDKNGLDSLLNFADGQQPPDEVVVQEKILGNLDRLDSSKGIDTSQSLGNIVFNSETLDLRHKAELFAESIARASTFHNATARIETTLTYLFIRFIAQPDNRRALIALMDGFRDFKFDQNYASQFRLDHSYWYNAGKYGLTAVLAGIFLIKFAAPKVQRFKVAGSFVKKIATWFSFAAKETKPIDPSMRLTYQPSIPYHPVDREKQLSTLVKNEKGELVVNQPKYRRLEPFKTLVSGTAASEAPSAASIEAALKSSEDEVRNSLIGRFMNLDPQERLVWILTRVGAVSLASMVVGGGRYGLEKANLGHWNEVAVTPEDEINTVLEPVLGLRLACEANQFETTLTSRNYNLAPDDQYRNDVEKLNSLVEEYALVRLPIKGYDRIDLVKYMASVNDGKLLEGQVSISMDQKTDQIHFMRQYKADRTQLDWDCPGGALDLSMKRVEDQIRETSSQIQSAHVLQNIEQALANLNTSLVKNPKTADMATYLRSFDVTKDDTARLPDNVNLIFRHYAKELLDISDDTQFNETVAALASRVKPNNAHDGTAAFLAYLQKYMAQNQSSVSVLKKTPFEILGVPAK